MQKYRNKHTLRRKSESTREQGRQPGGPNRGRSTAQFAGRNSGRRRGPKNDSTRAEIPGAGENFQMELAAERIPIPTSAEFDRIIAIKSQSLLRQTPEAAAEKISDVIMPALAGFIIAANSGLYWWLGGVFLLTNLIMKMEEEPAHLAAIKQAAGIPNDVDVREGNKPFLLVLQALGPLPAEDGSGDRRRAQNRYSNYHLALEAAQEEGLDAEELLERLVHDRGIEKLLEQRREAEKMEARGAEQRGEGGDDADAPQARSQRRKRVRDEREEALKEFATGIHKRTSRRGEQGQRVADESQADLPFERGKPNDADSTIELGENVRPLLAKPGKFVTVTHVAGSGGYHLVVRYAQPLPRHRYGDDDGKALTAMIRSLRK